MWGTFCPARPGYNPIRFIPTHVGNIQGTVKDIAWIPVHPHACGEHLSLILTSLLRYGSSPRMWGTFLFSVGMAVKVRFIPTHVGNIVFRYLLAEQIAVHPHACGEHFSNKYLQ